MNAWLPYLVGGIATGAIYGLAGTGLVLTYKTTGIFNLAHGAIAALAAYAFYWLHVDHGWDWVPAMAVSVLVLGVVLGYLFELLGRRLARQRVAYKIVGTIGVVLLIQGLMSVKYGHATLRLRQFLPRGTETFEVGGVVITYAQVTITVVALVAVGALYVLFYATRLGLRMRAVVDDPNLLSLHGTSPRRVRRVAWVIGSTFAALSGVLVAPQIGIEAVLLTYLVVQAFGAAAIGGFSNIPLTFAGGILLGIATSVSTKLVLELPTLKGLPQGIPFIVLIIALVALPKRKLQERAAEARPQLPWSAPPKVQAAAGVVAIAGLALVPLLVGNRLPFYTVGLTQAIMLLSLGLLVRTAGLVSLGHAAFGAIGAVAFAQLIANYDLPWLVAVLLGALVVVPIAALLALPAIRLSGLFLALATLGFGLGVERILYTRNFMFTSLGDGRRMPRPGFAQSDRAYYYVVLAFVVAVVLGILVLRASRLGRMVRGMSESNTAVTTLGLNTNVTRTIVFCISGFVAGLAGILYGSTVHFAVFSDHRYASFSSFILLATLAVVPFREPWYALFAAVTTVIPAYWTSEHSLDWINVLFGAFAILVALQGGTHSMPHALRRWFERFAPKAADPPAEAAPAATTVTTGVAVRADRVDLEVRDLSVRFGGHAAVADLALRAPAGRITGLIGPNGAGKTTTFNACSGLNRPSSGSVLLGGEDVSAARSSRRARLGLGRTFQIMQLCESLTVRENVLLGAESGLVGASVVGHLRAPRPATRAAAEAVDAALALTGITHLAGRQVGALSTGQRRLVELARCLAGDFDVLLLDEPSSGLDTAETAEFGEVLLTVVRERGCGILLVEHDMKLVMDVCDYIYVLDFGRLLFEGEPVEVSASPVVRSAYLGSEIVGVGA